MFSRLVKSVLVMPEDVARSIIWGVGDEEVTVRFWFFKLSTSSCKAANWVEMWADSCTDLVTVSSFVVSTGKEAPTPATLGGVVAVGVLAGGSAYSVKPRTPTEVVIAKKTGMPDFILAIF